MTNAIYLCSIVVTRGLLDFTNPPLKSELYQVDSMAGCYDLAAAKKTAGKFMFTVTGEDELQKFCGPDHSGCPLWHRKSVPLNLEQTP